ncbi:tetratricopeptide repeat protein [Pontiella sulfatireligans]|uniref:Beta-barrel assembly-enhancing protease n=1 Tax=Pontiella sulfatireligans TaxID=2750658 RepID=A0A6C2USR3_9BACT|nr:tetratricopeptide repeat protein [Pontiella sulfatireligans]VGO22993.1 hypothetical protein SCARR_05092 [Pontiella sulfatireligans]
MAEVKLEDAPQGVKAYCDKGVAAMERSNHDYAMDMFEAALKVEPGLLQVRRMLRAAAVKKTKANPPGKLGAAKGIGRLMKASSLLKKNPLQALELAEALIRIDPFNLKFAKVQCEAAEAAGLPEAAILTLESLKGNQPSCLKVLEPLARLYQKTGQFDLEYKCRDAIAKLKPNDSAALKELKDAAARLTMGQAGWQRDAMRNPAATPAANDMEQVLAQIEKEPGNLNHRRTLADVQLRSGQYAEAIQTLETSLELAGGTDPRLERKLFTANDHLVGFELANAEDADDREQIAFLRKKRAAMQIEHAARQAERYPNDLQLKFEYGKLLLESGQHTEAIQQFQLAQRNPQRRVRSLLYLARAFKAKAQLDIAKEQLGVALEELPSMDETKKEVLYELGALCEETGKPSEAMKCFKEIYSVDIGYRDVASKVEAVSN